MVTIKTSELKKIVKPFLKFGLPSHLPINDFLIELHKETKIKIMPDFSELIIYDYDISLKQILLTYEITLFYLAFFIEKLLGIDDDELNDWIKTHCSDIIRIFRNYCDVELSYLENKEFQKKIEKENLALEKLFAMIKIFIFKKIKEIKKEETR